MDVQAQKETFFKYLFSLLPSFSFHGMEIPYQRENELYSDSWEPLKWVGKVKSWHC